MCWCRGPSERSAGRQKGEAFRGRVTAGGSWEFSPIASEMFSILKNTLKSVGTSRSTVQFYNVRTTKINTDLNLLAQTNLLLHEVLGHLRVPNCISF